MELFAHKLKLKLDFLNMKIKSVAPLTTCCINGHKITSTLDYLDILYAIYICQHIEAYTVDAVYQNTF